MSRVSTEGKDDDLAAGVDVRHNDMNDLLRPILVGYAFGPKKMSTMSLVMAEASKAVSTVAIITTDDIPTLIRTGTGSIDNSNNNNNGWSDEQSVGAKSQGNTCETATLTSYYSDQYSKHRMQHNGYYDEMEVIDAEGEDASLEGEEEEDDDEESDSIHSFGPYFITPCTRKESSLFLPLHCSEERYKDDSTIPVLVQNISNVYKSSSSSAANSTLDELSISTNMPVFQFSPMMSSPSSPALPDLHYHRINISFVPLDLDYPLEEQHGGKFDVILHKMTEDILLTKFFPGVNDSFVHASSDATLLFSSTTNSTTTPTCFLDDEADPHAIQRVLRLVQYKEHHVESVLMDHPQHIQHLMSRSDISHILSNCLAGVVSRSGLPVSTPRYHVVLGRKPFSSTHWNPSGLCGGTFVIHQEDEYDLEQISRFIDHAELKYPLIAKPLAAAGTKHSHKMVIVLRRDGLYKIPMPCLVQEYVNHDSLLYKVYVLGDMVFVYPRTSLPNLSQEECHTRSPLTEEDTTDHTPPPPFVEFDSQESYPTMNDFRKNRPMNRKRDHSPTFHDPHGDVENNPREYTPKSFTPIITSEEVQPIADALRHAFGLELFGFDILLTDRNEGILNEGELGKQLLVVDVNYFPSYKEVPDFAPLLARYLAKRAIENRIKSVLS